MLPISEHTQQAPNIVYVVEEFYGLVFDYYEAA